MTDNDEMEAKYEDLCDFAEAVLSDPNHKYRDDFSAAAREVIDGLMKWISRLESRLSVSCQRNATRIAEQNARIAALEDGIHEAINRANGRWCEWGERAESVCDALEDALAKAAKP